MFSRLQAIRVALLVLVFALLVACASPPEQLGRNIDGLPGRLGSEQGSVQADIARAEESYKQKLREPKYASIADYTAAQQHRGNFSKARAKLEGARQAYENEVEPIAGNYADERRAELQGAYDKVNGLLGDAIAIVNEPAQWADELVEVKQNPQARLQTAEADATALSSVHPVLTDEVEAAKAAYPNQAGELDKRFAPLIQFQQQADTSLLAAQAELAKSQPNWAIFLTEVLAISDKRKAYDEGAATLRTNIGELSTSETHTLIDMRIDYFLTVERASWDEVVDFPTETDLEYPPVMLNLAAADFYIQKNPGDKLASYSAGFFGGDKFSVEGDRKHWDSLKLDPLKGFPEGDNMAEYYLAELEPRYCQKIHVVKNGQADTSARPQGDYCSQYDTPAELAEGTYWVEVDEVEFRAHQGDLGMDIYTKQAGLFASEAAEVATPPGMIYVGNPQFGQWNGDTWGFFPEYLFFAALINGPGYDRSYHNDWSRSYPNRSYYGPRDRDREYGTVSPVFVGSSYGNNSYYRSSGLSAVSPSIRGAGPAARGGGPGGGGK